MNPTTFTPSQKQGLQALKKCKKCAEEKPFEEFHNHACYRDGKALYCIPCNRTMMKPKTKEQAIRDSKKYKLANPEKVKVFWANYYAKNKESLREKRAIYDKTPTGKAKLKARSIRNKAKVNAQRRERRKNPTPKMVLVKSLRDRFYKVIIRCKNGTKHKSCMKLIGCDFDTFKLHIESQFVEGMNWTNHGNGDNKWNIDHIKPLVTFNLHDLKEQELAFHYTNLRPLWFMENMTRGRKKWQISAYQKQLQTSMKVVMQITLMIEAVKHTLGLQESFGRIGPGGLSLIRLRGNQNSLQL